MLNSQRHRIILYIGDIFSTSPFPLRLPQVGVTQTGLWARRKLESVKNATRISPPSTPKPIHHRHYRKQDTDRYAQYLAKKAEHLRISHEAFHDEGWLNPDHPCGVPQKGELVSRTNSPMFDIHPGEVLQRKRGPTVIYRHPNW